MPLPELNALLIDAPVNRHFAQLHTDSDEVTESVSLFVETGLRRQQGVVAIVSAPHQQLLLERLRETGLDPAPFQRSGQLRIMNAESTLKRIMQGDMPDWVAFRETAGKAITSVQTFDRSSVRAYGEWVSLLWHAGNTKAAIRLEEYWNELARIHPFSLFCSYMLDRYTPHSHTGPLHEIGRTHSDVIATAEDERFREALETAGKEIFGLPLSELAGSAAQHPGENRLPASRRAMLWIMRNGSASTTAVLERARRYMESLHMEGAA